MHTQLSDTNLNKAQYHTERWETVSLYFILPILVILGMIAYGIHFLYGFSLFPDEFGYWSPAATAVGYDWSEITALGYYYSFGYSIILIPVLAIFKGGVVAYRAAVFVNALIRCVSLFFLYGIVRRLFPKNSRMCKVLAVTVGVLYPVWTYYMQMTMVESLLASVYILICYLAIRYFEKPSYRRMAALITGLAYLYYLHMRTIPVFAAGIIILVIHAVNTDKETKQRYIRAIIIILSAVVVIVAGELIKSTVMDAVYAHSNSRQLSTNDYAGQVGRLEILLSPFGWLAILKSMASKLMYLGMSSFGMVYVAIVYLCSKTKTYIYTRCFVLATAMAQILLIAVANTGGRLDGLPYGRYIEHINPVFIAIGICTLAGATHRYRYFLCSLIYNAIATIITIIWSVSAGTDNMHPFCIAGISYLWDEWDLTIVQKYLIALGLSTVTMLIVYIAVRLLSENNRCRALSAAILILMEIVLGMHLSHMYVYPSSRADELDGRIVRYISDNSTEPPTVIYLSEGNPPYVDVVQFGLNDIPVHVVRVRSRYEEIDDLNTEDIMWVPDNDKEDYDGIGNMYRLTDESVLNVLSGYDADKLYILSDIDSRYIDALSDRYRCVMDTVWMKLYELRGGRDETDHTDTVL